MLILAVLFLLALAVSVGFLRKGSLLRALALTVSVLGVVLLALVSALVLLMQGCEPPSLPTLARRFPSQRGDLETILKMAHEDARFSRIAPTFLDRCDDPQCQSGGRFMENDSRAGLPKGRWDLYRNLYKKDKIELGVQRDLTSDDVFIIVDSVGLLNRGHATGYLHCGPGPNHTYVPCSGDATSGKHLFTGHGDEGYAFEKVADRWFVFDEGPS